MTKRGAAAVGLGVDVEVASLGQEAGGAGGELELRGGGGELHGPAMEGPDPFELGPQRVGGLGGDLVHAGGGMLLQGETEAADDVVELVVADAELLGQVGQQDALGQAVPAGPHRR